MYIYYCNIHIYIYLPLFFFNPFYSQNYYFRNPTIALKSSLNTVLCPDQLQDSKCTSTSQLLIHLLNINLKLVDLSILMFLIYIIFSKPYNFNVSNIRFQINVKHIPVNSYFLQYIFFTYSRYFEYNFLRHWLFDELLYIILL